MKNEFVPYDIALAMKELGFEEPCLKCYWEDGMFYKGFELMNWSNQNGCFNAPLYQQAFRWFREKHGLWGGVNHTAGYSEYYAEVQDHNWPRVHYSLKILDKFSNYEEAQDACLRKIIEIVLKV